MTFIQVVDCYTWKIDELLVLFAEWRQATEGKRTVRRSIVARDRHEPNHYILLEFFDSYESAKENADLRETWELAKKYDEVIHGGIAFHDLEILEDHL